MGKQMKEMFAAVKDLVGAHDGDSDATSESDKSDAGEEEDGVDETIQSLKEIKKKYKKLKVKEMKKKTHEKKKKFKQHLAKSKATIELKNERIAALKAKIVEMGNDQSHSGSDSKSSDVSDSDDSD